MQPVVFQSVLGTGSEQSKFVSCWNQERSPFTSAIELLMRLLILGSFGSVGIAGYSSFVERYFQIINKDLKIIYYIIFVLLTLQIIASAIAMMPSSANPISSAIRPSSSCSLGNL